MAGADRPTPIAAGVLVVLGAWQPTCELAGNVGSTLATRLVATLRPASPMNIPTSLPRRTPVTAAVGSNIGLMQMDAFVVAADGVHDTGVVPLAVRPPSAASLAVVPARQVTTWSVCRLVRM